MRFASCMPCCFLLLCCTDPYQIKASPPGKPLPGNVPLTVVRVDVDGSIAGSGVVVTPEGHIVTSSGIISRYRKGEITVGEDRVKATVVAVDARHRLALLKSELPLPIRAALGPMKGPDPGVAARIVGYAVTQSEPPMAERRNCSSSIGNPHYHGDSADDLDLRDLLIADLACDAENGKLGGSAVFTLDDSRLVGIVIGRMRQNGSSPIIAMPIATVRALLESNHVAVPAED